MKLIKQNNVKHAVTHSVQMASHLGAIRIDANATVADGGAIVGIYFEGQRWVPDAVLTASNIQLPAIEQTIEQLTEYFLGHRQVFSLPLAPVGTEFQEQVWHQIATIDCAQSLSYGAIAQRIDRPKASRAVGAATGRNPISVVIPCHRVLGSSGALTGYAGGLDRKVWLLAHEKSMQPFMQPFTQPQSKP
jgi:methylated-DNA-[protein]-cysteine S-methyltransferase